jgi:Apea-like HEPN
MADYYAITSNPLPTPLHGADSDHAIRTLLERERLAVEDYFFRKNVKVALSPSTTAVVVPQDQTANATMEDFAVLAEFALAILTVSGFQPITMVATLNASTCSDALQRFHREPPTSPRFAKKVVDAAASTWIRHFFVARRKTKDKLHITADRFVRYSRQSSSLDALVDLCICLESLIESQTEISFRFGTTLAKVTGDKNAEEISELLSDLYDLRSKVVHGTDSSKEHKKIEPHSVKLRLVARAILTTYVLFLTEHTKDEWKRHLRRSLFI